MGRTAWGRTAWATIAVIAGLLFAGPAFPQATTQGGPTPSPPGAKVEFIDIKDGAVIGPKTTIHFGLHGMGVAPAGTKRPNSGHHHLLVDADLPPLDKPIPNDENHLHFGGGQTETELSLSPGPHTLQLLLGDADHIPHTPPIYSDKIHVTVAESAARLQRRKPRRQERATLRLQARASTSFPRTTALTCRPPSQSASGSKRWASLLPVWTS